MHETCHTHNITYVFFRINLPNKNNSFLYDTERACLLVYCNSHDYEGFFLRSVPAYVSVCLPKDLNQLTVKHRIGGARTAVSSANSVSDVDADTNGDKYYWNATAGYGIRLLFRTIRASFR